MREHEWDFADDMIKKIKEWGERTLISEKQHNWLKRLEDKYL